MYSGNVLKLENKTKRYLIYIAAGTILLMLLAWYQDEQEKVLQKSGAVTRSEPGDGNQNVEMQIQVPEMQEQFTYSLQIPERELSESERKKIFRQAEKEIEGTIATEGESLNHITSRLNLSDSYADGLVQAEWSFSDSSVIDYEGNIQQNQIQKDGTVVDVNVTLSYRDYESQYHFSVVVFPEKITDRSSLLRKLQHLLKDETSQEKEAMILNLPDQVEDYQLIWSEKSNHTPLYIGVIGTIAAAIVIVLEKENVRRDSKRRKILMQREYPVMVAKMALLLGAGMSVKQSWNKILEGYMRQRQDGTYQELYEQMQLTSRQIQDGVSEIHAYEQFGDRSGLAVYRRFSMLLVQNLKKGKVGLITAMESEADRAFEERIRVARRLGEEASTKLLIPMMLMLGIVMIVLVVPAIMSMKI